MIKYLKVLPIVLVLSLAFAVKATPNSFSLHEEISYDKFGIANHYQSRVIELKPSDKVSTIKIIYSATVANSCNLRLNLNVPDVFSPEIKTLNSSIPITSDFMLVTKNLGKELRVEVEAEINLNTGTTKNAKPNDFLRADDGLFRYPIDSPEIKRIAQSLNNTQNLVELIENIKNYTRNALKYSDGETNSDIIESLTNGIGDCDDHARLFVTLSRALGIPARTAFNSNHMWAEVLMPFKDGYRWMTVDPLDSYDEISYLLSLDVVSECENNIIEDETWIYS